MKGLAPVTITALALAGCAPTPPMPGGSAGECSTAGLGKLTGQFESPKLLAQAKKRSGATIVRTLRPGQMVTMEYRNGRLDVTVDHTNVVRGFSCG